jgi:hypothetical protein
MNKQNKRLLLVLPLIVWPFLALIFWLLGGGSGEKETALTIRSGLNTSLPEARVEAVSAMDKLSFYALAGRDSMKRKVMEANLPADEDAVEDSVVDRSAQVRRQIVRKTLSVPHTIGVTESERVGELQPVIRNQEADPDIQALNSTLEKLVSLQNGEKERVSEREVNSVRVSEKGNEGFYGEDIADSIATNEVIRAVVHGSQTIQSGSILKMRLMQDVFVKGQRIPVGNFVFGDSEPGAERLHIRIHAIQYGHAVYPVSLCVLDMDGMEGIHMPGSVIRESVKQSAEQGVQSAGLVTLDHSWRGQAAVAGIGAAKDLISRRLRVLRVTVKSGYQILLRDDRGRGPQ